MVMVAHAFNLCTGKTRQADLCQFETSLVYRWSSGMAKAIYYTEKPCQEHACQQHARVREGLLTPEAGS